MMSSSRSSDSDRRCSVCSDSVISELRALEVHLGVFLDTTHANIDRLAGEKALLLAQKRASPLFRAQLFSKRQTRATSPACDSAEGVLKAIENLQNEAFSLGRDNEQYKARLRQQHKVMLTQMDMITYLEALLKLKAAKRKHTQESAGPILERTKTLDVIQQELQLLQDMLDMPDASC